MPNKVKYALLAALLVWSSQFALAQAAQHPFGSNIITPEGTVYTITQENNQTVRRPYTSPGAFLSYSFNTWDTIVGSSAEDLALPVGSFIPPQDGKIICSDRGADKGTCYLITANKKAGFTSEEVFKKLGYSFSYVIYGDVSFLPSAANIDTATAPHNPGTLINKDGTVYLVGSNGLIGLPSWATLQSWGYTAADIVPANAADRNLPLAGTLPTRQPQYLAPTNVAPTAPSNSSSSAPDFTMPFSNDTAGTSRPYNQSISFSFSATDAQGGSLTAKVGWGDNITDTLTVNSQANVPAVFSQFNHTYQKPGSYLLTITVLDNTNLSTTKTVDLIMVEPSIANPPSGGPKISFSANGSTAENGFKNLTVSAGEWVNFRYNVTNADAVDSTYSVDSADTCSGDFSSGKLINTWIIKTSNGLAQWYVDNCRAGHTYIFTVRGSKPSGNPVIAVETVVVTVKPLVSNTAPAFSMPVLSQNGTYTPNFPVTFSFSANDGQGGPLKASIGWGDYITDTLTINSQPNTPAVFSQFSHSYNQPGSYLITVTVTDSGGLSTTQTASIMVTTPSNPPTIVTTALPDSITGDNFTFQLQATGGIAPYKWGLGTGGTLPCCWLNVTQDGVVTPYQGSVGQTWGTGNNLVGQYKVSFYVTDANGQTATKNVDWKVKPSVKIQTISLGTAKVGTYMFKDISYLYFTNDPYLNIMTFSGLPPGISVDALDGNQPQSGPSGEKASFASPASDGTRAFRLSGIPTQSGTYTVNITISDSSATASASKQYNLVVEP